MTGTNLHLSRDVGLCDIIGSMDDTRCADHSRPLDDGVLAFLAFSSPDQDRMVNSLQHRIVLLCDRAAWSCTEHGADELAHRQISQEL